MDAAHVVSPVSIKAKTFTWQGFVNWLYVPNSYIGLTRRLTGLEAMFVLLIIWTWSHGGPGPTNVPAWRLGAHLFALPMPPQPVTLAIFGTAYVAALAMVVGFKHKLWPLILALTIGYYGSMDWVACGLHFIVLEWIMLVAFLFEREGRSPTRRLIQISIVACYFYTATQKLLFPDFLAGYSFETIFGDGWSLGSAWRGVLPVESFGHGFWVFFSWMTIAVEYFFAFGLSFPRTRRAAVTIAILFHLGISIFLDKFITIFSLVMWAGLTTFLDEDKSAKRIPVLSDFCDRCLQFSERVELTGNTLAVTFRLMSADKLTEAVDLEPGGEGASLKYADLDVPGALAHVTGKSFRKKSSNAAVKPVAISGVIKAQSAIAALFIAALVLVPTRVFFFPNRPLDKLSFFDRSPWSFCMYLARQETTRLDAKYEDAQGQWQVYKIDKEHDRWGRISCDNETYALAAYIFKVHPDAKRVRIENDTLMNGHLPQERVLECYRGENKEVDVRFLPPLSGIHLLKRTKDKGSTDY